MIVPGREALPRGVADGTLGHRQRNEDLRPIPERVAGKARWRHADNRHGLTVDDERLVDHRRI